MQEPSQVPVTTVVVMGVFDAIHKHATQTGVVQRPDAFAGGGSILAGTKVVIESATNAGEDEIPEALHLHELGLHEPHAKVHHGSKRGGMEHGRGVEELGGRDVGEEPLDVVEVNGGGVSGVWEHGGGRRFWVEETRRRESGGERRVRGVERLGGGVITEVP